MKKLLLSMAIALTAGAMVFGQTEVLINDFTGTLDPAKIYGDDYQAIDGPNQSIVTFEDNKLKADYVWDKPDWFPRAVWYNFDYIDMSALPVLEVKFMVEDNDNETLEVRLDLYGDGEEEVDGAIQDTMETNGNPWIVTADNGTWYTVGSNFTEDNRFYCTYWGAGGIDPTRIDSTRINGFEAFVNAGKADLANQPGTLWIDYIAVRDVMTGIEEVIYGTKNAFGLAVYPSPTSGLLKINAENSVSKVEVYNITGKLVSSISNINERQFDINVSELSNGFYIANIHDQKGQVVSEKFIKE